MAQKVFNLAKTMEGSKRSLGFSIEGMAIARDKADPSRVKKVLVTNIAITPNPKNSDSVVQIAKGVNDEGEFDAKCAEVFQFEPFEVGDFMVSKNGEIINKSVAMENPEHSCLAKEDLEGAGKNSDSVNKKKNSKMKKKTIANGGVTDEELLKSANFKKVDDDDDDDQNGADPDNDNDDDDDDDKIEKAVNAAFEKLEKSIDSKFRSLGIVLKGLNNKLELTSDQMTEIQKGIAEIQAPEIDVEEITKGLTESMESILDEQFSRQNPRKSLGAIPRERFEKGVDSQQNQGGQRMVSLNAHSDKGKILEIFDKLTFEKGTRDQEIAKWAMEFEGGTYMSKGAKNLFASKGVEITGC